MTETGTVRRETCRYCLREVILGKHGWRLDNNSASGNFCEAAPRGYHGIDKSQRRKETTTMGATQTETAPAPPVFPHRIYGVNLTLIGDEGAMMAEGHVPLSRFVAACNRIARTKLECRNLLDWSEATLQDALDGARHCWALPAEDPHGDECDWYVRYDSAVTAETPGAIPVTLWEP
jgi:hypothetical protein